MINHIISKKYPPITINEHLLILQLHQNFSKKESFLIHNIT